MEFSDLLYLLLIIPLSGAVFVYFSSSPYRNVSMLPVFVLLNTTVSIVLSFGLSESNQLFASDDWFFLDALSLFHLFVLNFVFLLSSIFANLYFKKEVENTKLTEEESKIFSLLWLTSYASMVLVLISNNIGMMWVGMETTTLLTAFLICLHSNIYSLEAMWKYLIICSIGMAFALLGTILVGVAAQNLETAHLNPLLWSELSQKAYLLDAPVMKAAFIFLIVGYGTKAGLAPMHNWLPDAHSQAPAPVSALFSGFMLNAALYCIMRFIPLTEAATGKTGWALELLTLFGVFSLIISAVFIIFQNNLKRLLAYCSIEHLGIIAIALGTGGFGYFLALLHTLNHSVSKSLSFFAAGKIGQLYGSNDMKHFSGVVKASPYWGFALIFSMLALIGIAPLSIFISKLLLIKTLLDSSSIKTVLVVLIASFIIFTVILKRIISMAFEKTEIIPDESKTRLSDIIIIFLPIIILVFLGFTIPAPLFDFLQLGAEIIGGKF